MSSPAQIAVPKKPVAHWRLHLPTVPEAFASLLRTVIVALFLLTFVLHAFRWNKKWSTPCSSATFCW